MLLRALNADISPTAKLLAAALYAIGPEGGAAPAEEVLTLIGIRTPGALRHLRTELADAHIASTRLAGGQLTWQWIGAPQPAAARPTDARVPQTRTAAPVTAVTAPTARATDAQRVPHTRTQPAPARPTDARVPRTRTAPPVTPVTSAERVCGTRTTAKTARPPDARVPQTRTADPVTPVTTAGARPTDALIPPHTPPVGRLLINTINSQTDLPTPLPPARPAEPETTRSLRLLRAVGVHNGVADAAVGRLSLRQIAAKVAEYLADRDNGAVRGAGVLKARLAEDAPESWLPLDDPAWNHPLLAQHIAADLAAWRAADAAEQRAAEANRYRTPAAPRSLPAEPAPATDPDSAAGAWLVVRDQLRLQLPASTWKSWVSDTTGLQWQRDAAGTITGITIRAASQPAADWLRLRLTPLISRTLAAHLGRPVVPIFEAP